MESSNNLKFFSPVPVRGTNYGISIEKVVKILRENFGDKFRFTNNEETIYIDNLTTKAKNCAIVYKDSINYGTAPWTLIKELIFKEFYSCGNSEEYLSDPSEFEIIEFFKKQYKL